MWRHALLEIYSGIPDCSWPLEGTPASWIADGKVGYCDGRWSDAVAFLPLWKLLWWKARGWAERLMNLLLRLRYGILPDDDVTWRLGGGDDDGTVPI